MMARMSRLTLVLTETCSSFDVDASVSSVTTGTGSASIGTTTISDIVITGANQSEVEGVISIKTPILIWRR